MLSESRGNSMIGYFVGGIVALFFFLCLDKIIKWPCFVSFCHGLRVVSEIVAYEIVYVQHLTVCEVLLLMELTY